MLAAEAEFPLAGSTAYLRGDGQKVRIVQRLPDAWCIIAVDERFKKASSSRRVPLSDLAATQSEAWAPPQPRRRKKAAA